MEMLFSFTDIRFWLYFVYFLLVTVFAFFIPGAVILKRYSFTKYQSMLLSFILGIVLFSFQGMLFGYLGLRWLSYGYIIGMFFLWLRQRKFSLAIKERISFKKIDPLLLIIVSLGVFVQLVTVWFIGYRSEQGMEFCCFWPDSFYHLALVNELATTFPPFEPGMSGIAVKNYHFLGNLVVADLVRIFRLPLIHTQYQYMSVFLTLLFAGAVVGVGEMVTKSKNFTRWLVFFIFFSGDIIFLLLLLLGNGLDFSVNVSENATTFWFSPPRVYALVILFGGIMVFLTYLKNTSLRLGILLGVLLGSLIGFKIYLGFFALCGLGIVMLLALLKRKYHWVFPVVTGGIVSSLLYFPVNSQAGGLFFSGLWRIDNFAIRPAFGLMKFELAKQVYAEHKNFPRIFLIESIYFLLYIFSLFGMFLIGFFQNKHSLKLFPKELHVFLLSGIAVCFVIGMFFLQKTGGANTLQFLFAIYIVGSFYASLALTYWLAKVKRPLLFTLISIVIILTSFRVVRETYINVVELTTHVGYYVFSNEELAGVEYINSHVDEQAVIAVESSIALEDNCYILSTLSDRGFFLCGNGILEDHGVNTTDRVKVNTLIFKDQDIDSVKSALKENTIKYLYVPAGYVFGTTLTRDFLDPVYEGKTVHILKVNEDKMQ